MKIYDISQELFGCCVFPGDPAPEKERVLSIAGWRCLQPDKAFYVRPQRHPSGCAVSFL